MRPIQSYNPFPPQPPQIPAESACPDLCRTPQFSTSISIPNPSFLIPNCNYTFSAKERDPETGLSYFGSRYYSSDLSIWLCVDPMTGNYPSLSSYVYCANNPVRLVDPNGEEIGDYFDQYGTYLGSDCRDDGKIHIIDHDLWDQIGDNMSWVGNDGTRVISYGLASDQHDGMFSKKTSETNLSEDAIFNIVKHYNSTSLPLGIGDKTGSELLTTQTQVIDVTHDGITNYYKQVLQCNTKVWEKNSRLLDNYYNIINAFDHESHHINTFNEIGGAAYLEIPDPIREINAIQHQQSMPSYQRTSKAFKNGINDYYDEQLKQLK